MIDEKAPSRAPGASPTTNGSGPPPVRAPITVYKARRPKSRKRRLLRGFLWTLLSLIVVVGAAAGSVFYFKIYEPLQKVTDIDRIPDLKAAQNELEVVPAGRAATVLVIGSDHRIADGTAGSRSDTLMLMNVNPQRKTLSVLSIPRDLRVQIPGHGTDKINAAYSIGKTPLAVKTVQSVLGPSVKINYIISVDFRGFRQTVDQFGGVWIDVDRRYLHKNAVGDGIDDYAEIDIMPGYQRLGGQDALDYVRYRHTDGDFLRLARQQAFIREFKRSVSTRDIASELFKLISIVKDNVKVVGAKGHTPGPQTMLRYARLLNDIPRNHVFQFRITGTAGNYVDASPETIQTAVRDFLNPDLTAADAITRRDVGGKAVGPVAAKPKAGPPPIKPAKLRVATINGSGEVGAAANAMISLKNAGYGLTSVGEIVNGGNAPDGEKHFTTQLYFATPKARSAARILQTAIGDATLAALSSADPALAPLAARYDVVVVVGQTFEGITAPSVIAKPTVPPKDPAQTSAAPAELVTLMRPKQRRMGFPLLIPARVPSGTQIGDPIELSAPPVRGPYRLEKHGKGLHLTARVGPQAWGMQWTNWAQAPILDEPSGPPRLVNGRLWKLYFNGAKLHRIAVFYGKGNRYVAWVNNTLDDKFSSSTMKVVANSLRPVPRR